jgi:hypothetical protein
MDDDAPYPRFASRGKAYVWATHNAPDGRDATRLRRALIDTLDMYVAAGVGVESRLSRHVIDWYANGEHRRLFR